MKITSTLRVVFCVMAAVALAVATGCNTVRGAGRDISHVGGHIEQAGR